MMKLTLRFTDLCS